MINNELLRFEYGKSVLSFRQFTVSQRVMLQRAGRFVRAGLNHVSVCEPDRRRQTVSAEQIASEPTLALAVEKVAVGETGGIAGAEVAEKAGGVAREARTLPCAGVGDHNPAFTIRIVLHQGACA